MVIKKYYFKKIKSTNEQAIKLIKKGLDKGIVIADKQTHGRGQHGKKWVSLKGNLFMTIFFRINPKKKLSEINKYNCEIVRRVLKKFIKKKLVIKYPNDILIHGKKICGILHETVFYKFNKSLVVGIGINIVKSPKINDYKTTFLNEYTSKKINKIIIFKNICKLFKQKYRFS